MAIWCENGVSKVTASSGNKREFVECLYLVPARTGLRHARAGRLEPGTTWAGAAGIGFPFPAPQNWNRAVGNGK
jgi:hypothetical protein